MSGDGLLRLRASSSRLLLFETLGDPSFDLLQTLGGLPLQSGLPVRIIFAPDPLVGLRQLIVTRWAVRCKVLIGLQRSDRIFEAVGRNESGSQPKIGFRKAGIEFGRLAIVSNRRGV